MSKNFQSELARSLVMYLEQEDPTRRHREKVVCSVNLGDFELQFPADPDEPEKKIEDGRTIRRKMWDEAVLTLTRILNDNGLNPRYVRNDKNACRLIMKQDGIDGSLQEMPDEFFTVELFYLSIFELEKQKLLYVRSKDSFDKAIQNTNYQFHSWVTPPSKKIALKAQLEALQQEKRFFTATMPDPREMDCGLIFRYELFTTKEYGVTKSKFRQVLTTYVTELSRVAQANGTTIPANLHPIVAKSA